MRSSTRTDDATHTNRICWRDHDHSLILENDWISAAGFACVPWRRWSAIWTRWSDGRSFSGIHSCKGWFSRGNWVVSCHRDSRISASENSRRLCLGRCSVHIETRSSIAPQSDRWPPGRPSQIAVRICGDSRNYRRRRPSKTRAAGLLARR